MRSATARQIMAEFHGVEIGAHSYGDCFDPKIIPRGITIGRYVSIAAGVRMFTQNHPLDRLSTHPYFYEKLPGLAESSNLERGQLIIGHDAWLGCNAIITPGCHRIGNGAVIGAGAVVTKDVPDFAIVGGCPAKQIRSRFSVDIIERLQDAEWWNLSKSDLLSRSHELSQLLDPHSEVPGL